VNQLFSQEGRCCMQ